MSPAAPLPLDLGDFLSNFPLAQSIHFSAGSS